MHTHKKEIKYFSFMLEPQSHKKDDKLRALILSN